MKLFDEKRSGAVREAVDELVGAWTGVEAKPMMGCPGWRAKGALFVSVIDQGVMFHTLGEEDRAALVEATGAQPFRPRPGREMAAWPVVPTKAAGVPDLADWLRRSYEGALAKRRPAKKPAAEKSGAGKSAKRAPTAKRAPSTKRARRG